MDLLILAEIFTTKKWSWMLSIKSPLIAYHTYSNQLRQSPWFEENAMDIVQGFITPYDYQTMQVHVDVHVAYSTFPAPTFPTTTNRELS